MEVLRRYLNSLAVDEQRKFARRCGTSIGYLRKSISAGQKLGIELVIAIERESKGAVRGEELRPEIDWAYLTSRARNVA